MGTEERGEDLGGRGWAIIYLELGELSARKEEGATTKGEGTT